VQVNACTFNKRLRRSGFEFGTDGHAGVSSSELWV